MQYVRRVLPFAVGLIVPAYIYFKGASLLYQLQEAYASVCVDGEGRGCKNIDGIAEDLEGIILFAAFMSFIGTAYIWEIWQNLPVKKRP